jgi:large subunit ribosomal protein L21
LVYAVVRTGGKQYRVEEGHTIDVERLGTPEGERVELSEVLLLADGDNVTVGTPTVPGAKVTAEVVAHGRGKKITVFKYKAKTRHRAKTGHRQAYTRLAIREIEAEGEKPKARRRKKTEAGT